MKTPDQIVPDQKEEKMNTAETEPLQPVFKILRETAEKFRSLKAEATATLLDPENLTGYKEKLEERARLLVNLPESLEGVLKQIDPQVKNKIESYVKTFATIAQERINIGEEVGLATLLVDKGARKDDKNSLEKLIDSLENE